LSVDKYVETEHNLLTIHLSF